ncbi:hypothetical protein [Clostridium tyrobutyricum]|uniref:hypothetical protein n=1 Tax=Clostridium tyrobutyricum TaxID=1519 RepID=UPI001C3D8516|nr:hypothetical protein [Clostridium tyrobutyricum]MBV4438578.1 hypothetical protein [Clostridium tyrobutyricum]
MSKVKLSNRRLLEDRNALMEVSKKQLPVKVSYAIAKNLSRVNRELKVYDSERQKLIEKYSFKDLKGNPIADERGQIKFQDQKGWEKDIKDLLDIENEIDIHTFPMKLLEPFNISPAEIMAMDYMIKDDENTEQEKKEK